MARPIELSGRTYLQSIMYNLSLLQNLSDAQLDELREGLKRVDNDLDDAIIYLTEAGKL